MPTDELTDLINNYYKDALSLREQVADLWYVAKGSIDYNSAWGMSFEDRQIMINVINKRLKDQDPNGKEYM